MDLNLEDNIFFDHCNGCLFVLFLDKDIMITSWMTDQILVGS